MFDDEPMDEDVYEVEKIVDATCQGATMFYLVRWKGYGPDEDTWEPSEHLLSCQKLQEDFWKVKEHKRAFDKERKKKKKGEKREISSGKKNLGQVEEQNQDEPAASLNSESISVSLETSSSGKSGQIGAVLHTEVVTQDFTNRPYKEALPTGSLSQLNTSSNQKKPHLQDFKHDGLSSISYSHSDDDISDTDTRTKELLAKWGDRRYQAKPSNNQSSLTTQKSRSRLSLKSSKYSYEEKISENDALDGNAAKNSAIQAERDRNDDDVTYIPKRNTFMPSPDKTLLSSESIRNIIQQDLMERENKKRTAPVKSVEYDWLPGRTGADYCHASNLKPMPPANDGNEIIKSHSRASFSTRNYDAEIMSTELKTNIELEARKAPKSVSKESIEVRVRSQAESPLAVEKGSETQAKFPISVGSEIRKKLRDLGSNIRDLKKEQLSDKSTRSANEHGGILSNNEQKTESVSSKLTRLSPFNVIQPSNFRKEDLYLFPKKKDNVVNEEENVLRQESAQARVERRDAMPHHSESKQQVESANEHVYVGEDPAHPQKKVTVTNKLNFDRIKGMMKGTLKEKGKELDQGNNEKCVIDNETNTLDKYVLSSTQVIVDKGFDSKGNIQSIGQTDQETSKAAEKEEGNLILQEMRTEDTHERPDDIGADKGEKNEGILSKTVGPSDTLQNKTWKASIHIKDGVKGKLDNFARNPGHVSIDSVTPSAEAADGIGCTTGTHPQDTGFSSRENRQLETTRTRPDGKTTKIGPASDRVHTESEKLFTGRKQMKRFDFEKGESRLKASHESIKLRKANEKVERRDSSKFENRVDIGGTVRSPSLDLRGFSDITKVMTSNVGDSPSKRDASLKRDLAEVVDSRERKALDTRKKLKALRYSFQKHPSREEFPPAADDVLGGILGKSSILRAIDEGGNKRGEHREEARNDRMEMEERQPSDVVESAFDLDQFYIDDDGLFPSYEDSAGEGKRYLDSIDVSGITPIDMSPDDFARSVQAGEWHFILGAIASGHSADSWDYGIGGTLLWKAIEENNYAVARKLIKFGADIEVRAENGKTALMFAVETGNFGFVDMLLKSGSHINAQQHNEETALILACRKGDEDIVNLLLCYGVDAKLTPKSNPKDVHEYAPEYQLQVIRNLVDLYNAKLANIADEVLQRCLLGTETFIDKPQLCRCITPGERIINEFYFNCQRNAAEKGVTILLLCAPIKFAPSGDIALHLERKIDNGIDVVILNKEYQIPVVQGSHILYFLFPKVGQLNTLSIRTHKCNYKLLVAVYSIEQNESWVDNSLDSFYKEFGAANNVKFTKYPK